MCQGGGGRRADQNRNSPSRSRDSRGPFFPHLDGAGSSGRRSKSTSPESAPVSNTTSTRLSMCVSGQRGWHCVCIAERPEVDTLLTGGLDTTIHQHQLAGLDLAFRLMLAAQGHRKARHRSAAVRHLEELELGAFQHQTEPIPIGTLHGDHHPSPGFCGLFWLQWGPVRALLGCSHTPLAVATLFL